ncbi:MAG: hypothetical protein ABEL51_07750 [Salinibacter sp.]
MGQQQLLLLVLSTVIVGLATVAGIQAFDENRAQAASDALTQKAAQLAADIKGLDEKPQATGGLPDDFTKVSNSNKKKTVAALIGISDNSTGVSVPAADGSCTVNKVKSSKIEIKCTGTVDGSSTSFYGVYRRDSDPQVVVNSSALQ